MPTKQALIDKMQGSVAAYLRCGGVVGNQGPDLQNILRQSYDNAKS